MKIYLRYILAYIILFKNLVKDDKFVEYNPIEIAISCIVYNLDKQLANYFLEIYDIKESEYKHCLDHLKG